MSTWPTRPLGEICRESGGFIRTGPFGSQLHRSDYVDDQLGVPVVMPKDMARGRINTASIARIDASTAERLKQHLLSANDVVLARRGDVGRSAWVFESDLPAFCGTGCIRVHPGASETVRPAFLRFFFHTKLASDYLEGHAVGSTMPNLNSGIVEGLPVPVPPLRIQDSLVGVLEAFDTLIENNRRRIEVLEEMARAIYREWFVKFRYPGHEDVPMVDSALGPIPEGWSVGRFGDLARVSSGKRPPTRHPQAEPEWSVPVVGASSVMAYTEAPLARDRILITGRVGTHGVVQRFSRPVWPSDNTLVLSPEHYEYTYQVMLGIDYGSLNRGAAQPLIAQRDLTNLPSLIPSSQELRQFEQEVGPLMAESEHLTSLSDVLAALRDRLLPKLVTGQIDVSTLDLDALFSTSSTDASGSTGEDAVAL